MFWAVRAELLHEPFTVTERERERRRAGAKQSSATRYEFNFIAYVYLRFQRERIINPLLVTCSNFLK